MTTMDFIPLLPTLTEHRDRLPQLADLDPAAHAARRSGLAW